MAAAFTLSAACGLRKVAGFPGYALIATAGDNTVAAVDLLSFRLLSPISVGAPPTAIVPGKSNQATFVLTPSTGSVHVLDANFKLTASRKLAQELAQLRMSPKGDIVALSSSDRKLFLADHRSLQIKNTMALPGQPIDLDISAAGDIAVSLGNSGGVELWTASGEHHSLKLDGQAGILRFRSDGKLLIIARPAAHALTVVNVPQLQVLADLPLAMEPRQFCFSPDGGQLFVTGPGMDAIAIVFPYNTLEVEQTILAGPAPGFMACSADPFDLFVASRRAANLTVLDADNRKILGILPVGLSPCYITVTPDSQYALVLDEGSGDLAVVRIPDIHRNHGLRNGIALFRLLNVGNKPIHAAVIPRT